jgi:hypothetical protein
MWVSTRHCHRGQSCVLIRQVLFIATVAWDLYYAQYTLDLLLNTPLPSHEHRNPFFFWHKWTRKTENHDTERESLAANPAFGNAEKLDVNTPDIRISRTSEGLNQGRSRSRSMGRPSQFLEEEGVDVLYDGDEVLEHYEPTRPLSSVGGVTPRYEMGRRRRDEA